MSFKEYKVSFIFLLLTILSLLVVGALIFSKVENWAFLDALYFVTITATTVGYGDFAPTHTLSKILTMIYALSIIPFVLYTFSLIAKFETERVYHQLHGLEKKQKEQKEEIEKTEKRLSQQKNLIKEQEKVLETQGKKIKKQTKADAIQEKEIAVTEKELGVVEDIMEKVLVDKKRSRKKS